MPVNRSIDDLHPTLGQKVKQLTAAAQAENLDVLLIEGFRSFERQQELYDQGRTVPGTIVTNARPGQSWHNYGLAADMVFLENGRPSWADHHDWDRLGQLGRDLDLTWGGDWAGFPDRPHFQWTGELDDVAAAYHIYDSMSELDWRTAVWRAAGEYEGMPAEPQRRTLRLTFPRMYGDDVRELQQRLWDLGYAEVGEIDGYFGPMTEAAVKAFQRDNGSPANGVVGPTIWAKLLEPVLTAAGEVAGIGVHFGQHEQKLNFVYGFNEADDWWYFSNDPHRPRIRQRHQQMQTRLIRIFVFDKNDIQPRTDWPRLQGYIQAVLDIGALPMVTLARIPGSTSYDDEAVVNSFAGDCEFVVRQCIDQWGGDVVKNWYWCIWNEPNNREVNSGHPLTFEQYRWIYTTVAPRIKAQLEPHFTGPAAHIGGPAVDGFDPEWLNGWIRPFVSEIDHDLIGFVTWHRYASFLNPLHVEPSSVMAVTVDYGDRAWQVGQLVAGTHIQNLCGELNASSFSGERYNTTHFNVAYYASAVLHLIKGGAAGELFWEATNDARTYGTMDRDGDPLPVCYAKSLFANYIPPGSRFHLCANTTGDTNVEAIAAQHNGRRSVLLIHKHDGHANYSVVGVPGGFHLLKIDQSTGNRVVRTPFGGSVAFDGYGVAVLTDGEPVGEWWSD